VAPLRATAFGLDIWPDRPLPFLWSGASRPTGRTVELITERAPTELRWPREARLICDERDLDGRVVFQIEQAPSGYRIAGPRYGEAIVAADGKAIAGAPGAGGDAAWERLLIGQVLPFAAVLQGLEPLHASAVAIGGETFAMLGGSGAGKTSVAVALGARGAAFMADDVLALERRDDRLVCHPGPPVAGVARAEAERLRRLGQLGGPVLAEDEREAMVAVSPRREPAPLGAIFALDRRADGPATPRFDRLGVARELLAATFNLVLEGSRLEALLDVCSLAAERRNERVSVGPGSDASQLAAAIEARIGSGA
jgi:hypothetical protein